MNLYGLGKSILSSYTYRTGVALDVTSGKWSVSNYVNGQHCLGVVVRRGSEIVADALIDADARDGVSDIEFADPKCGMPTRRKVSDMLRLWVERNRETVYPKR